MDILKILDSLTTGFPFWQWSLPPNYSLGVLATNQAFLQAKQDKKNPVEVASQLADQLKSWVCANNLPVTVKTAGPYINLDIDLDQIDWTSYSAQVSLPKIDQKVLLDYTSPNVAKPLHAGHMRNANLGEVLRRILKLKYTELVTDNHWGDWGVQFGILIWAWKHFLVERSFKVVVNEEETTVNFEDYQVDPVDTLVKIYIWGNAQKDHVENWEELVRNEFVLLEQGDAQNRILHNQFVEVSKESIKVEMALLNVPPFDLEQGESFYEEDMRLLTQFMEEEDVWQKEGLARYFDIPDLAEGWEKMNDDHREQIKHFGRCYLISSNGYTTYAFRDVAARWQWARDIEADLMITLTGNEQRHNFDQAFSIISYLATLPNFARLTEEVLSLRGQDPSKTDQVLVRLNWTQMLNLNYGFLSLPEGKMSTRKGKLLKARDLIFQIVEHSKKVLQEKGKVSASSTDFEQTATKVAIASLKWYDLCRDSASDIVLDVKKVLAFEGNTGVYQLYTVVRLGSILKGNSSQDFSNADFDPKLLNDIELQILKQTFTLPFVLENICQTYKPHTLCNYLFDLATKINGWYVQHSVSDEKNIQRKKTLLWFCSYLRVHMIFALDLLAIETVEEI